MLLQDIKEFFCELLNEFFKGKNKRYYCSVNCNCRNN